MYTIEQYNSIHVVRNNNKGTTNYNVGGGFSICIQYNLNYNTLDNLYIYISIPFFLDIVTILLHISIRNKIISGIYKYLKSNIINFSDFI